MLPSTVICDRLTTARSPNDASIVQPPDTLAVAGLDGSTRQTPPQVNLSVNERMTPGSHTQPMRTARPPLRRSSVTSQVRSPPDRGAASGAGWYEGATPLPCLPTTGRTILEGCEVPTNSSLQPTFGVGQTSGKSALETVIRIRLPRLK